MEGARARGGTGYRDVVELGYVGPPRVRTDYNRCGDAPEPGIQRRTEARHSVLLVRSMWENATDGGSPPSSRMRSTTGDEASSTAAATGTALSKQFDVLTLHFKFSLCHWSLVYWLHAVFWLL